MDQRVSAIATDKCTRDPVGASEFFKESKEHDQVALMVIMAGPQVCNNITSTAPLVCPDNPVQQSQIYRLEEFTDVDDTSHFRWKIRPFCRIDSPYNGMEETRTEPPGFSSRMWKSNSSNTEDNSLPDRTLQGSC